MPNLLSYRMVGDRFSEGGPYAHNQYLHVTAELGIAGLSVFLAFLIGVFGILRRQMVQRQLISYERAISAGLGASLVGYLLIGCFESSLYYGRGLMTFWLLVGLIMAVGAIKPSAPLASQAN